MKKWTRLVLVCGATLLAGSCATDIRDAIVGGALDYVSASTSNLLGELLRWPPGEAG